MMTPLRGVDGQVYAFAQGSVLVSGFGISGKDGSKISLNVPSSAEFRTVRGRARGTDEVRFRCATSSSISILRISPPRPGL